MRGRIVDAVRVSRPVPTDLDSWSPAELAGRVEEARRSLGRIRYGSVFRVGVATVVLNPDSPLVGDNLAAGFTGTPAAAEETLASLTGVFADSGRVEAAALGSPSSLPEMAMVAEEAGYEAVDEGLEMVLTDPTALVPDEPGAAVRPVHADDEQRLGHLLADALDLPRGAEQALTTVLGHRLDDSRVNVLGAYTDDPSEDGEPGDAIAGMALGFVDRDLGVLAELAVDVARRRRGLGRALASAAAATLLRQGATVVVSGSPLGGHLERFWGSLGFAPAYETSLYARRVETGWQTGHSSPGLADAFGDTLARDIRKRDHG